MTAPAARPRRRHKGLVAFLVMLGAVLVVGYLIYGTTTLVEAECSACISFRGQTECRRGSGTDSAEALRAAAKAACALMANGMDESISCQNVRPTAVQCPPSR